MVSHGSKFYISYEVHNISFDQFGISCSSSHSPFLPTHLSSLQSSSLSTFPHLEIKIQASTTVKSFFDNLLGSVPNFAFLH